MFELCIDVCNNVNDVHDFVNPLPKRKALRSPCSPPMSGFGCYDSAINPSCKVWFTNISEAGDQETFCSLVERIKEIDEKKRITKFVFPADQKRAYFSGVLQRAMIRDHLEVGDGEFTVCRPAQNKPYAVSPKKPTGDWNYNVSHHGDYVCIASHPSLLIGADLVDVGSRPNGRKQPCNTLAEELQRVTEYLDMFVDQFTPFEREVMNSQPTVELKYAYFYVYWSLKESYVKAIGRGLSFDLQQIEFTVSFVPSGAATDQNAINALAGTATARINGIARTDWTFNFVWLDGRHVMTIALGPLTDDNAISPANQGSSHTHVSAFSEDADDLCTDTSFTMDTTDSLYAMPVPLYKSLEELLFLPTYSASTAGLKKKKLIF